MTNEEAIKYFRDPMNYTYEGIPVNMSKEDEAVNKAIEALEKQTAKSLVRIKDARWNYQCVVCGCKFMGDNFYEYCPRCGQKLIERTDRDD